MKIVENNLQTALDLAETNLALAAEMDLDRAENIQASVSQVLREADSAIANALQIQEDKIRLAEEELAACELLLEAVVDKEERASCRILLVLSFRTILLKPSRVESLLVVVDSMFSVARLLYRKRGRHGRE